MILPVIKKYALLIKWGGIAIAVAAVTYYIYDYTKSKEMLKQLNTENTKLEFRLDNIKEQVDLQLIQLTNIRSDYKKIELTYSKQLEEINDLRQLTKDYIQSNKPVVEEQLNLKFNSMTNRIECLTGNNSKCES